MYRILFNTINNFIKNLKAYELNKSKNKKSTIAKMQKSWWLELKCGVHWLNRTRQISTDKLEISTDKIVSN